MVFTPCANHLCLLLYGTYRVLAASRCPAPPQSWFAGLPAVLRPLDATSWAEVPLALQLETPEGRTVLLRLTLKRRKLPHLFFDPLSDLPSRSFPEPLVPRPIIATGATAAPARIALSAGTAPTSKVLSCGSATPHPRFDSDSRTMAMRKSCRMDTGWSSYRNSCTMQCGTGTVNALQCRVPPPRVRRLRCPVAATPPHLIWALTRHPSASRTDAHCKAEVASEECPELPLRDWLPGLAGQAPDVFYPGSWHVLREPLGEGREFKLAPSHLCRNVDSQACHPGAANAGHPPSSPCSISFQIVIDSSEEHSMG